MMYAHAYTLIVMQINTCTHMHIIIVIYTCMQPHTHSHTLHSTSDPALVPLFPTNLSQWLTPPLQGIPSTL